MSETAFARDLWCALHERGLSRATNPATRELGLVTELLACSATLGDALMRAMRFASLVAPTLELFLSVDARRATLSLSVLDWDGRPESMEKLVLRFGQFARRLTGTTLVPLEVRFTHEPRAERAAYARLFGTPNVHFRRPHDGFVFDSGLLGVRLPGDDDDACRVLEQEAEVLLEAHPRRELLHKVKEAILDGLSRGDPGAETVAHKLGVHPKTLSRRLRTVGTTHRRLLDQIRYDLAERYLRESTLSVQEIAYLLGFFDTSSFNKACKRWTGRAPHHHRAELVSSRPPAKPEHVRSVRIPFGRDLLTAGVHTRISPIEACS